MSEIGWDAQASASCRRC